MAGNQGWGCIVVARVHRHKPEQRGAELTMTKTRELVPPVQQGDPTDRTVKTHLFQLAGGAYAMAERSLRRWYGARRAQHAWVAAHIRQRMLKHQAIAYHLDTECRRCHEPG